jgi:hypothetical protein
VIIRLSREHTINTGHYENIKVGGSVEFNEDELKDIAKDPMEFAREQLDDLLSKDLEAALAAVPEDSDTHLNYWKKED